MGESRFVVLLRAGNVGGRALPMAALRAAVRAGGFPEAETLIASGNLVLAAAGPAGEVERRIEALIAAAFGLAVPAIARHAGTFARLAAGNPFPGASPRALHLVLAKRPIAAGAAARLAPPAAAGERVAEADGALRIDFGAGGVGRSKLTPALIDRVAGPAATARNANTVARLLAAVPGREGARPAGTARKRLSAEGDGGWQGARDPV